jgi:hypothetical protein
MLHGMNLGATSAAAGEGDESQGATDGFGTRVVENGQRVRDLPLMLRR